MDSGDDLLSPRLRRWRVALGLLVLFAAAAGGWWSLHRPRPELAERRLFRQLLPAWEVLTSRGLDGAPALDACVRAAQPWPEVAAALQALPDAWRRPEALRAATARLNQASRSAGLPYWVDPQFPGGRPVLTTHEVLGRATWQAASASVEVLHVRRLDALNVELALLGHASGDQPAVLRDQVERSVVFQLSSELEGPTNEVDRVAAQLWRDALGPRVDTAGLAEATRRLDEREKLAREMEHRLKNGRVTIARPERLVFGDRYFEELEPLTSPRLRGGPLLLASDLRALRRADEALDDSAGLQALVRVIDLEAELVEAHEAHHALDTRVRPVPPLLSSLVGEDDEAFAHLAEQELRAYLGELRDAGPPACLSVVALAQLARGAHASATPHFFAAHALLATLARVDGSHGLSPEATVDAARALCGLPDAQLRERATWASEQLYGEALPPARRVGFAP